MPRFYRNTVDLFTADEHAVLANWLGVGLPKVAKVAKGIEPDEAIARMGFETKPHHYRLVDAVVASIVLEKVEKRLPTWSALRADGSFVCARKYRDDEKVPNRKVLLQSRQLFTINWADSGPGFSWPVAYYVTWLPHYDRFVVTASADCADGFGYCDFAIGAFGSDTPIKEGARSVVCGDWKDQRAWEQQRWAYLFKQSGFGQPNAMKRTRIRRHRFDRRFDRRGLRRREENFEGINLVIALFRSRFRFRSAIHIVGSQSHH
jgi:hypothetical protein